ncbi:MAG: CaiB/BaiF CoA-transferase family protein [Woeseiaceae bacterium]|nr:CaiB/BaiF CoA-transferase family protein [Woeseiaceae bacterium]
MGGPLAGLKVLDLSRVLAGPWATQLLADYGADVVKIERPGHGDDTREWGPPWLQDGDNRATSESAYFLCANRNKHSITVDLTRPAGQRLVHELAAQSDVLVENFRVGTLARYDLDAATLRERYPALIYCSISAYGQAGSALTRKRLRRNDPGGRRVDEPDRRTEGAPQKTGVAVADLMAGMYAVSAILAALHARERSGTGQTIDVPLFDTQVAWLANQAMNYLVSGEVPVRHGNGHPNIVPYQAFATADGHLMLAVGNDSQFRACVDCLGITGLAADPRFATNRARVANRDALIPLLATPLAQKGTDAWLQAFEARGIPAGPINDLARVFADPQVAARGLLVTQAHSLGIRSPAVANPVVFSDTPAELRQAPPLLGEHTASILSERLGYSEKQIAELRRDGAI